MPIIGLTIDEQNYSTLEVLCAAKAGGSWGDYPLPLLKAILHERDREEVHVSVTEITSGAWRRVILEALYPYYVNLENAVARTFGTWLHQGYAVQYGPDVIVEKRFATELDGLMITGQVDAYDAKRQRLMDLKTTGKIHPNLPYVSQLQQLAGYILLLEDNGYVVEDAQIHYMQRDGEYFKVLPVARNGEYDWVYDTAESAMFLSMGASILYDGIKEGIVPGKELCNSNFCPFCDVVEVCEEVG